MVGVAQLVELRIVIPAVVGSSPIVHPSFCCSTPFFSRPLFGLGCFELILFVRSVSIFLCFLFLAFLLSVDFVSLLCCSWRFIATILAMWQNSVLFGILLLLIS